MEDNEFEEVTIISHTDRPHRVFSEKSIEKLKEQISLEIVKEISGTEDKTYSDDPRLAPGLRELEKLKQDHFGEGEDKIHDENIYFISRVAGESGQYLLGSEDSCLISNGQESKLITDPGKLFHCVVSWRGYLLAFTPGFPTDVYCTESLSIVTSKETLSQAYLSSFVHATDQYLYYMGENDTVIMRLDPDLQEDVILNTEGYLLDFFVCPKTETITTLCEAFNSQRSILKRNGVELHLPSVLPDSRFYILKKMYSDHFLVGETIDNSEKLHKILLYSDESCCHITTIGFSARELSEITNIRLLAPRQGINCFLVLMNYSLELFCEYRLKLYHLKTLEIKDEPNCLSAGRRDFWMIGCQKGRIQMVHIRWTLSAC